MGQLPDKKIPFGKNEILWMTLRIRGLQPPFITVQKIRTEYYLDIHFSFVNSMTSSSITSVANLTGQIDTWYLVEESPWLHENFTLMFLYYTEQMFTV